MPTIEIGAKFGYLTVFDVYESGRGLLVAVRCVCGTEKTLKASVLLKDSKYPSCGCMQHTHQAPDEVIRALGSAAISAGKTRKAAGKSSRFKGVYRDAKHGVWRASIRKNGKNISLGTFEQEETAARAYDEAALKIHGDGALTNARLGLFQKGRPNA